MNKYNQTLIPCIYVPELYVNNCCSRFFGFDERLDKSGETVGGFFLDIATYDGRSVITILCKPSVRHIRWTDEGIRLKDAGCVRESQPNLDSAFVYRIENSEILEWYHDQSFNIHEGIGFRHYLLATCEEEIDVICTEEPVIFEPYVPCSTDTTGAK